MIIRKIMGGLFLMIPLMVVGCGREKPAINEVSRMESKEEDNMSSKKFSLVSRKEKYKDIEVEIPKKLKKIDTQEDMLLYAIEDSKRNISISSDNKGEESLASYIGRVKSVLGETIDLSEATQGDVLIAGMETISLEYQYNLGENTHCIYQVCFEYKDIVYIFTLGSDKENLENDKVLLEEIINSFEG